MPIVKKPYAPKLTKQAPAFKETQKYDMSKGPVRAKGDPRPGAKKI